MSMFPTAGSTVYRNEDGEVLGWSDESYSEPEYCDYCGGSHGSFFDCSDDYDGDDDSDDPDEEDRRIAWMEDRAEAAIFGEDA